MALYFPAPPTRKWARCSASAAAFACLLGAFSAAAHADDSDYSASYRSCMDKASGVTASMIDCIGVELQRQDQRLNAAYRQFQQTLKPARRQQLQAVQREWLQYRQANCRFQGDPDGGTAARVAGNACVLAMTATRARELEQMMPVR
ncbi:DUF1311 domain-containing protein [Ottowia sp. GY511]|uniref:Lysozyme inhibitor LprI family protein n=1 Tax=Ottowia flava TaxID=2675430 RepID=A0ABW4KX42_9BURK|nr:lysozyme inhibitor LprI family protein [Ottowia sp. GY511]TXK24938.1 DUF1311 domain-containing protein [Ottowia sp. GY511]